MEAGYKAAARTVRQVGQSLPIRTLGFLSILALVQFAVLAQVLSGEFEGISELAAFFYIVMPMGFLLYGAIMGVRFEQLRLLGVLFFGAVGFIAAGTATLLLYGYLWGVEFGTVPRELLTGTVVMQVLYVACGEELVFRFALPQSLKFYFGRKLKPQFVWLALLIPQISFALYHWAVYEGDWGAMLVAFAFGCLLMAAYYVPVERSWGLGRRMGLGFCIGAHAAYNLVLLGVLSGGVEMVAGGG